MENRWYAVLNDIEDTDWEYGSFDLEEARQMLADMCVDFGGIAVINGGICEKRLMYKDLYDTSLVVVDRRGSDEWHDVVDGVEEADRMWDLLTKYDKHDRDYFYLCKAFTHNGSVVAEIEDVKRYK